MKSLYELTNQKRKNSVLKSMFVSSNPFEREFTNTRISIEPYDDTFLNAEKNKGSDYIFDQLLKQLNKKNVIKQIEQYLNHKINNIRVGYYSDHEHGEIVFIKKGDRFMWQSEAYNW